MGVFGVKWCSRGTVKVIPTTNTNSNPKGSHSNRPVTVGQNKGCDPESSFESRGPKGVRSDGRFWCLLRRVDCF